MGGDGAVDREDDEGQQIIFTPKRMASTLPPGAWSDGSFNDLEGFQHHRQNFRWHARA
jgi:hypothetical protein